MSVYFFTQTNLQLCDVDIYKGVSENKVTDTDAKSCVLTLVCTIYYQCAIHTQKLESCLWIRSFVTFFKTSLYYRQI